jgi:hypothetical protein
MGSNKSTSRSSGGGMGPAQSMAMAGNTGLASATEKQAQTIKRTTGKSFKAIGQKIGEVGSKYRRPADVEKYAKELSVMEAGDVLGAKKFTGPDGVERVSFVGTGMKDEQGRTILSKQIPQLTAQAPTLRQLGGDIARGLMGYNTIEYVNDKPTMVEKKGLIPTIIEKGITPGAILFNAVKGTGFFQFGDSGNDSKQTTTTTQATEEFAQTQEEIERKRKLAGSLISSAAKGRSLFRTKARTITGGMD